MTDHIVVLNTCATEADAERLSRALVDARLAACVTILPGARSIYHWQGAVEENTECLLLIKSSRELFPALQAEIEKLHSYAVPEVLALPVVAGSDNYLNWLKASLREPAEPVAVIAPVNPEAAAE
jgi:periplasmic divalent cation tolerance protein